MQLAEYFPEDECNDIDFSDMSHMPPGRERRLSHREPAASPPRAREPVGVPRLRGEGKVTRGSRGAASSVPAGPTALTLTSRGRHSPAAKWGTDTCHGRAWRDTSEPQAGPAVPGQESSHFPSRSRGPCVTLPDRPSGTAGAPRAGRAPGIGGRAAGQRRPSLRGRPPWGQGEGQL